MEIDITDFFNNAGMIDYSASAVEIGQDAAQVTWSQSVEDSPNYNMLDTPDSQEAFRSYAKSFGAWDADEIAGWTDIEANALCMQMIAGNVREAEGVVGIDHTDWTDSDWYTYEANASQGRIGGNFYRGDDGRIYTSLGI